MKRLLTFVMCPLIIWGIIGLSGCTPVPLTHYYTFHPDMVGASSISSSPLPDVLAIGTFEADIPYQQDKIVFRKSPYEVAFYEYRKWLRPLPQLVSSKVLQEAAASGMFSRVHGQAFQVAATYILIGKISMFDRWDSPNSSEVRVQIVYQLLDSYGEQIIWTDAIETSAPVLDLESVEATVLATVTSFETALHENIQQALEAIHNAVSRQP